MPFVLLFALGVEAAGNLCDDSLRFLRCIMHQGFYPVHFYIHISPCVIDTCDYVLCRRLQFVVEAVHVVSQFLDAAVVTAQLLPQPGLLLR